MLKCFLAVSLFVTFSLCPALYANDNASHPWGKDYEELLLDKVGEAIPELLCQPFFEYPNENHPLLLERFESGTVPIFAYGSLINKISAARSVKPSTIATMQPVVAFGRKRIFNYAATKTKHWGSDQDINERAMLNLTQTLNIATMTNGVVLEVDQEDLALLVDRELGYDLIPILVASWNDVIEENPGVKISVAYTFVASNELREGVLYTSGTVYPVRGYLNAIQEASYEYGEPFAEMWNATTFLADGVTPISDWDGVTFTGILSP